MEMTIKTVSKSDYPLQLQQIKPLPETMSVAGALPGPEYKYLCVIGSRNHSYYGRDACRHLIRGLSGRPIAIVSGLAIGIDSLAHEAALEYGLKTVAFPGSGLSPKVLYPSSRRSLASRIVESGGALVSPFGYEQEGTDWTFPVRNRLMAGISHATLIIEAGKGSGTLLTAGYALGFDRDVLVVHGSIFSELSYGPHMLIRDGATPISSSQDILRALGFDDENGGQMPLNLDSTSFSAEEKRILAELQLSPLSSEELMEKTSIKASHLNTLISQLELQGMVREEGGIYKIKH